MPLDFIFRRALKRYVKAHLEDGMKRWKSFIRRAQAVERLLKKVTPYAITIQRHMRGYLGRKRAAVMREIRRIELKRLRIKSATQLQVWPITMSVQLPPFWQGLESHSSISAICLE